MTDLPAKLPKLPMLKPSFAATGFFGKFSVKPVVDAIPWCHVQLSI